MPIIFELGLILTVIALAFAVAGYAWSLPGYNRKKVLLGRSASYQMQARYYEGQQIKFGGLLSAAITAFIFFIVLGMFVPIDRIEREPGHVNVMIAQGQTIVLADGNVYTFDRVYRVKRVYYLERTCSYGFVPGLYFSLEIEEWKREEVVGR